jgi:hypothetical protein
VSNGIPHGGCIRSWKRRDLAEADGLLGDAGRSDLVTQLALDPEAGDMIPGTGGFRKLRAARPGMGKRGGVRVVYILNRACYIEQI